MKTNDIIKYPRTKHIEGSGLQKGDEDLDIIRFGQLRGKTLVVEEKIDGANTGISFSEDGDLLLQSRGHYLVGGDWPEFDQFKMWGNTFANQLFDVLENRYIMYGEWMYAFHSVFYDNLPHYFMEFDIYDKVRGVFLDTPSRKAMTDSCNAVIESVRVIETSSYTEIDELLALIGRSAFMTEKAPEELVKACKGTGWTDQNIKDILELNKDLKMEGLYIKWEEDGIVKERYKYVRAGFVQAILDYGKHWSERKTIPNLLAEGRDLFEVKS